MNRGQIFYHLEFHGGRFLDKKIYSSLADRMIFIFHWNRKLVIECDSPEGQFMSHRSFLCRRKEAGPWNLVHLDRSTNDFMGQVHRCFIQPGGSGHLDPQPIPLCLGFLRG